MLQGVKNVFSQTTATHPLPTTRLQEIFRFLNEIKLYSYSDGLVPFSEQPKQPGTGRKL